MDQVNGHDRFAITARRGPAQGRPDAEIERRSARLSAPTFLSPG